MKECPKCSLLLPVDSFYRCKKNKDGLQSYCKTCIKSANKLWAGENKGKFKEYDKKFRNTEHRKAYVRQYKEDNKESLKQYKELYRRENKERIAETNKSYTENNKDKILASKRTYVNSNREKVLESSRRYGRKNRAKYAGYAALRRARVASAQPRWLSPEDKLRMEHFWKLRELKSFVTGIEYEVDHIVPLNGSTVCGLHVPWNLELLPAKENRSKGARYWPDMW